VGKVSSPFLWAGKKQVTIIRHRVNRSFLIAATLSLLMAQPLLDGYQDPADVEGIWGWLHGDHRGG